MILFRLEEEGAEVAEEGATLIGPTAEAEGFTAENVREGVAASRAGSSARMEKPAAVPSGRGDGSSSWGGRIFKGLIALLVLAAIAFGAWYGNRQVWFLGTDEAGRVSLYRGLPYELPFGVDLYSEYYSSPVTLSAVPEERRDAATNHTLRSRDDAESLLDDLQQAAESNTATGTGTTPGGGTGTGAGAGNTTGGNGAPSGSNSNSTTTTSTTKDAGTGQAGGGAGSG